MRAVVRPVNERPSDLRITGPDGAAVVVEWFRKGTGVFGVDRRCIRAEATHGRVTITRPGGSVDSQRVVVESEVDAVVASARSGWPTPAPIPAPGPTHTPSTCPRCDLDRAFESEQGLLTAVGLALNLGVNSEKFRVEVYACSSCGSLELFLPGRFRPSKV